MPVSAAHAAAWLWQLSGSQSVAAAAARPPPAASFPIGALGQHWLHCGAAADGFCAAGAHAAGEQLPIADPDPCVNHRCCISALQELAVCDG